MEKTKKEVLDIVKKKFVHEINLTTTNCTNYKIISFEERRYFLFRNTYWTHFIYIDFVNFDIEEIRCTIVKSKEPIPKYNDVLLLINQGKNYTLKSVEKFENLIDSL